MANNIHVAFKANDRSYFAILKKEIHAIALKANFSDRKMGEIDIIVAEIASNLVKHAGGGQILVKLIEENEIQGIEIISIDNGPGMTDLNKMVTDGVSTTNTLGLGLGTIKRLSDNFHIYSQKNWGTVLLSRKFVKQQPPHAKRQKAEIKSVVVPKPGEVFCGDGFYIVTTNDHIKLFLGDGLGHGPEAEKAVCEAGNAFADCTEIYPPAIIRHIDASVRKTRGLVGMVAVFDLMHQKWELCGVGNIATRIIGPSISKNYMAYNGIIGLNVPRTLNAQEIIHEKGQSLTMCSDGLKSRWEPTRFTGILRQDLSVLAASLYKDYSRNIDDASIAICKINS